MTSSSRTNVAGARGGRRGGFTLIELLIVAGIIVVLVGILLPALGLAMKRANRTRMAADIQSIAVALDAYRSDFKDYPRVEPTDATLVAQPSPGANVLAWAIAGLGSAAQDGADGPGFRTRMANAGKVYGPYVQLDRFQATMPATTGEPFGTLNDKYGHPFLYAAARPNSVANVGSANGYVAQATSAMWNANDIGVTMFNRSDSLGLARIQSIFGADTSTGALAAGSSAVTTPYVVWSAGPDELYGPDTPSDRVNSVPKCDDPTNFR